MTERTSVTLQHPIEVAGARVGVLTLRRPLVRDLEAMERAGERDIARSVALIANLAELSPDEVRTLDAADFMAVSGVVAGFLAPLSPG
jgi:hypothetical protein